MDHEQLKSAAPAVFALNPSNRMSGSYKFIPTISYIEALTEKGWDIVSARQPNSRKSDPSVQKHLIILGHPNTEFKNANLGHVRPRIALTNSHDGTTQVMGNISLEVKVCGNGLYVGNKTFDGFKFRHNSNAPEVAAVLTDTFFDRISGILDGAERWQSIQLSNQLMLDYANEARVLRFGDDSQVTAESLLVSRRNEDNQNTLWKTFNRVQENVMKGGIKLRPTEGKKTRGRQNSGEITNITQELSLNQQLWDIAARYADLVGA